MPCFDFEVAGAWTSEWCLEHEIVDFPRRNPLFERFVNMPLVLHRDDNGDWQPAREMWNRRMGPNQLPPGH
jgi:hypothetical protein